MENVKWTIESIKEAMESDGSYWWDCMRPLGKVYEGAGGIHFATSQLSLGKRCYFVHRFSPETLTVDTIEKRVKSGETAKRAARILSEGKKKEDNGISAFVNKRRGS